MSLQLEPLITLQLHYDWIIYAIIVCLSIIQSIFGVGLLVFGTPALLYLGFDYVSLLWVLLPPSFAISSIQFRESCAIDPVYKHNFLFFALPTLVLSLTFVLMSGETLEIGNVVAAILLIVVLLRIKKDNIQKVLEQFSQKNIVLIMLGLGSVHGATNMGGTLLSIVNSQLFQEKVYFRSSVVYSYWFFGLTQLSVLIFTRQTDFKFDFIVFTVISAFVYLIIGRKIFNWSTNNFYAHLLTFFMFAAAIVLLTDN